MVDRNPSPPREFEDESDKFKQDMIGNTTISKKWIFSTLLSLCKEVEKHDDNEDAIDISDELQDEACRLWDLCVESELAEFLVEAGAVKIFAGIILKSNSPRLTEIVVGVLGNLSCNAKACLAIVEDKDVPLLLLSLLSSRDTPTLIEVNRLLCTSLSNKDATELWLDVFNLKIKDIFDDVIFILSNSTNVNVLKGLLEVLDTVFDLRTEFVSRIATASLKDAILESCNQLIENDESQGIMHSLHLFHTLLTEGENVSESLKEIYLFCIQCCKRWKEKDEVFSKESVHPVAIASCISVLNIALDFQSNEENRSNLDLKQVPSDERKFICSFCEIIQENCESTVKKHEDVLNNQNLHKNSEEDGNTDENNEESDSVPLKAVVGDLFNTLTKLKWLEKS